MAAHKLAREVATCEVESKSPLSRMDTGQASPLFLRGELVGRRVFCDIRHTIYDMRNSTYKVEFLIIEA